MDRPKILDKDEMIEKMFIDLYVGEDMDHPPITARLRTIENKLKSFDKTFWLGVGILATLIGKIIAEHVGVK